MVKKMRKDSGKKTWYSEGWIAWVGTYDDPTNSNLLNCDTIHRLYSDRENLQINHNLLIFVILGCIIKLFQENKSWEM